MGTRPRVIDLIRFLFFPSLIPRLLGGERSEKFGLGGWLVGWLVVARQNLNRFVLAGWRGGREGPCTCAGENKEKRKKKKEKEV